VFGGAGHGTVVGWRGRACSPFHSGAVGDLVRPATYRTRFGVGAGCDDEIEDIREVAPFLSLPLVGGCQPKAGRWGWQTRTEVTCLFAPPPRPSASRSATLTHTGGGESLLPHFRGKIFRQGSASNLPEGEAGREAAGVRGLRTIDRRRTASTPNPSPKGEGARLVRVERCAVLTVAGKLGPMEQTFAGGLDGCRG